MSDDKGAEIPTRGPELIDSPSNPKIKFVAGLRDRKERDAAGCFAVEGTREIARALDCGYVAREFYACQSVASPEVADILKRYRLVKRWDVSERAFEKIAVRESSGGIVAIFETKSFDLSGIPKKESPLFLIVDGVEKPGNLGALLRTADGAGVDAVLVSSGRVDRYNPHTIRASIGTVFALPVISASHEDIFQFCRDRGARIFAASPEATCTFDEVNFSGGAAIALGAEDLGLASFWDNHADEHVMIPMRGVADSLNVAASGAILLYAASRGLRR